MKRIKISAWTGQDSMGDACLFFTVVKADGEQGRYLTQDEIMSVMAQISQPEFGDSDLQYEVALKK